MNFIRRIGSVGICRLWLLFNSSTLTGYSGKRVVYLSSLSMNLVKQGLLDKSTLSVLNEELGFVVNENSFDICDLVSTCVWGQNKFINVIKKYGGERDRNYLTTSSSMKIAREVIDNTPSWLKYDHDTMIQDVVLLLVGHEFKDRVRGV